MTISEKNPKNHKQCLFCKLMAEKKNSGQQQGMERNGMSVTDIMVSSTDAEQNEKWRSLS
jgi:hypothetical protein